jgi:uncharacterized protein DUF6882
MSADGKIHFRCPHCDKPVSVAQEHAGKRGTCPGCGKPLQVPAAEPAGNFDALLERSLEELRIKTAAHDGVWQLSQADWDIDQDAGTIVFTSPKGMVATCPVQIIGTFNADDNTWLWGWDHPSVDPALQEHARLCRDYGEKHGIDVLTAQRLQDTSEDDCWQLTALACHLAQAQGAYRGPMGSTKVFVTFGRPSLQKRARGS